MTNMTEANAWQRFYGRETELNKMDACWKEARCGNPYWVSIIAESGLGKTRLVQEFFKRLSSAEYKENKYWPDTLSADGLQLSINPAFDSDCVELANSEHIPWLWWGIRGPIKADERNLSESRCAIRDALQHLEPHLFSLTLKAARDAAGLEIAKKIGNLLSAGWLDPLISIAELLQANQKFRRALSLHRLDTQNRADRLSADFNCSLVESIFKFLECQIPVILVLDDIHFFDDESLRFVRSVIDKLSAQKLKLMVISTSWSRESNSGSTVELQEAWHGKALEIAITGTDKDSASSLLRSLLPGVSEDDINMVVRRADGNFRYLIELYHELVHDPRRYFKNSDIYSSLTDGGRRDFANEVMNFDKLVKKRISSLENDVQEALEQSSFQGHQFDEQLLGRVASTIAPGATSEAVIAAINRAEKPGAVVATLSKGLKEFLQGPYWKIAHDRLTASEQFDSVEAGYFSLVGNLEIDQAGALSTSELELLERFARDSENLSWKAKAYGILLISHAKDRRYEKAIVWLQELGGIFFEQESKKRLPKDGTLSEHGVLQRWCWPRDTDTAISQSALEIIGFLGFNPLQSSHTDGRKMEEMGMTIAPSLQKILFDFLEEKSAVELPSLARLISYCESLVNFRAAFGHSNDLLAWVGVLDQLSYARLTHQVPEKDVIAAITTSLREIELRAPTLENRESFQAVFDKYEALGKKTDLLESSDIRSILKARVQISILVFGSTGWKLFPEYMDQLESSKHVNWLKAVKWMEDILYRIADNEVPDEHVSDSIRQVSGGNELVVQAMLSAGAFIVEMALKEGYSLAIEFSDRLRRISQTIGREMEGGAHYSHYLAAILIDVLLTIGLHLPAEAERAQRPDNPIDIELPDWLSGNVQLVAFESRDIALDEVLQFALFLEGACKRYYRLCGGRVDMMVLAARVGLFGLSIMKMRKSADSEIAKAAIELFTQVIGDATKSLEGRRVVFSEHPLFVVWLVYIFDYYLVKFENAGGYWESLRTVYREVDDSRFDALVVYARSYFLAGGQSDGQVRNR